MIWFIETSCTIHTFLHYGLMRQWSKENNLPCAGSCSIEDLAIVSQGKHLKYHYSMKD